LELERCLPLDNESIQSVLANLFESLVKENESSVRAKIAQLIGQLSNSPSLIASCLVEDIINVLKTESKFYVKIHP